MKMRRSLLLLTGILFTAVIVAIFTSGVQGVEEVTSDSPLRRADVITIDAVKSFGDLEQPPVVFLHDLHTDALEKQNKDCSACHLSEENRQSPRFKRLKDTSKQEVMDIYHVNCQQCHREVRKAGEKSGPVEVCGQCHQGRPRAVSDQKLIVFDKSLHYRHTEAAKDKCESCHHQYDEVTKKLFYAKGKEGSCIYCHKQQTEENRISMRLASH
ncbi:MAG: cytochrome c3 family protein, partial [Desulfobulbia bacterium]